MSEPTSVADNVLGQPLKPCCHNPKTGFFRDGFCHTDDRDVGVHTVCAVMTEEFLQFSRDQGNDLTTPHPEFGFPGLKPGDKWCLCAARWQEAHQAGVAPPLDLEACHRRTLEWIELETLKRYANWN